MTTAPTTAPSRQHLDLPLTEIAAHPRNSRRDVGDVTDLADSFADLGVLEPLIVAPWPTDLKGTPAQKRKHLLIAGHRRLAAAKKAKLDTVPTVVRSDLDTLDRQLEAMLVENLHRTDLTPVEEAEAYQALLEFPGFTQTKLAKDIGQPVTRIRDRLKLTKLDEPLRDRLHTGQLTIADALAIGEFADDAKTTKQLLAQVGSDQFKHVLSRARNDRAKNVATAKRVEVLEAAGVKVRKTRPDGGQRIDLSYEGLQLLPDKLRHEQDKSKVDQWVIDNHATCEGAVTVVAEEYYGGRTLQHWCTTPKVHPKPKRKKSAAELAAEKAEAERKAQVQADVDAHTPVRRGHLTGALTTTAESTAKARLVDLVARIDDYGNATDKFGPLLEVLGVALPAPEEGKRKVSNDQVLEVLRPALADLTLAGLVVALDVVTHRTEESELDSTSFYGYYSQSIGAWLDVLQNAYGYAPSEFELSRGRRDDDEPDPDDEESADDEDDGYGVTGPDVDLEDVEDLNAVDAADADAQEGSL